jgi:hypothetical protein
MTNTIFDKREWQEWSTISTTADRLKFLVSYAVLAPSHRNAQPWKWVAEGDHLDLYADRTRQLTEHDPLGRQVVISCGAALEHLLIAMRHFGYAGEVQLLPASHDSDWIARVQLGEPCIPTGEDHLLFDAIPKRHTNRHIFETRELPAKLLEMLHEETINSGAWMHIVDSSTARTELMDLIAQGDEMQGHDRALRDEVADWMRPNDTTCNDGIPGYAMSLGHLASYTVPLATRWFDRGVQESHKDWLLAGSAPVLVVLGTESDLPRAWIATGRALSRILLHASAAGVAASFFNQPIEVSALWPQLRTVIHRTGFPQLIFRLGYPTAPAQPTPRRNPEEVTVEWQNLHNGS